jgi:hypothetical protein
VGKAEIGPVEARIVAQMVGRPLELDLSPAASARVAFCSIRRIVMPCAFSSPSTS